MLNPECYRGREQTYVKHFFLEKYLERVVYNICSFDNQFVYVDGFSGPWKSDNQDYADTSFKLSLDKLRHVRQGLRESQGKEVHFKCLFIENDATAFRELQQVVGQINDIEIKLINGSFEDHINDIYSFVGNCFSLIFIDPTGWEGFSLNEIKRLFSLRSEILINFMSDFINRFITDPRPEIAATFDRLFGPDWFPEWAELLKIGMSREAAAIDVYTSRIKAYGNFDYVTPTRVLKPQADRSYFYLIYATKHWKGIQEFSSVESKAVDEQERVRNEAKYRSQVFKTGQRSLFGQSIMDNKTKSYQEERNTQITRAQEKLIQIIQANPAGINYEHVLGHVLEMPLVWKKDLDTWLGDLRKDGKIIIPDMKPKERVPKKNYKIFLTV